MRGFRIGYARAVRVSGDSGSYAKTGNVSALLKGYRSAADQGAYAFSGQSATLAQSGGPGPGPLASDFIVTSAVGGTNVPFALGYAFRQGDVPSGQIATTADASSWQCDIKNAWPDGSARFAILTGRKTLTAGVAATITLSAGSASGGTALTTTDLKTAMSGQTCSIACGAFGTVSWATTDFDSPFQTWISGPVMSSWIYRKPVGSDAHLVGWIEVRLFAGGAVEVLPWIENGYLLIASPTNKSATYSFTLGASQRFSGAIDLLNHQRAVLASGTTLTHWLGSDPGLSWKHNAAYLKSTKLVPNYFATTAAGSASLSGMTSSYTPLAQGDNEFNMGSAGATLSIAPLPRWDALYVTSNGDIRPWRSVQVHCYLAGRYGYHFRDEATNLVPLFGGSTSGVAHNTLGVNDNQGSSGIHDVASSDNMTPLATGGQPPQYYTSHAPAYGYFAYLITGRFYALEECQFQAFIGHFKTGNAQRQGVNGIFPPSAGSHQTRSAAWCARNLAYAATITPDSDSTRQGELRTSLYENAAYLHSTYGGSPGYVQNYSSYSDSSSYPSGVDHMADQYGVATWQEAYLTFAYGMARDLDLFNGAQKTAFEAMSDWKYTGVVRQFGADNNPFTYPWQYAVPYGLGIAMTPTPAWNAGGSQWMTPSQQISYTYGFANADFAEQQLSAHAGDPVSYWAQHLPALSYAVDHGRSGASESWSRISNATDWASFVASFPDTPEWGVAPRKTPPAWYTALANNEITSLPNSIWAGNSVLWSGTSPGGTGTAILVLTGWSSSVLNTKGLHDGTKFVPGQWMVFWGGGHNDYAGNEVYAYGPIDGTSPTLIRLNNPTIPAPINQHVDGNGKPVSRHTYHMLQYVPEQNRMVSGGVGSAYQDGNPRNGTDFFNFSVNPTGAPWSVGPDMNASGNGWTNGVSARDPVDRVTWFSGQGLNVLVKYDEVADSWTNYSNRDNWFWHNAGAAIDPGSKVMLVVQDDGTYYAIDTRAPNTTQADPWALSTTGTAPPATDTGILWDPAVSKFAVWSRTSGKTVYYLTPPANPYEGGDAWVWSSVSFTGVTPLWAAASSGPNAMSGVMGHWRKTEYPIPGYVLWTGPDRPGYFFKRAA